MNEYFTGEIVRTAESDNQTFPFCRDALRKVSRPYLAWLIIALLIAIFVYILMPRSPAETAVLSPLIVYYLICTIHVLFRFKTGGKPNILAPDIFYILVYTMFHLGYVTLYGLSILPYDEEMFVYDTSIAKALLVINIGLIGFLFGYEILGIKNLSSSQGRIRIPSNGWSSFGFFLMITAVVMHFGTLMVLGPGLFMEYGYQAVQDINKYASYGWALLWQMSNIVMTFGIAVYTISSALRYGKLFAYKSALILVVLYYVTLILEGERGAILLYSMPILFVRHYFISPIRIRYLALFFVAALFLFTAMSVMRSIVFKPVAMLHEYQYQKSAGKVVWYSPFVEMGKSFLVVDIVTEAVPKDEPYWKGASWRDAAYHVIPFFQRFAISHGWSQYAPSEWLRNTFYGENRAGRAFTVVAEGYLNFGFAGAFIEVMLFGMFLRWLTIKFSRRPSAMWGIIMLGCIGPIMMTIRGHLNTFLNVSVQITVIGLLLQLFLKDEAVTDENDFTETESSI
jgi:hypothetical protein